MTLSLLQGIKKNLFENVCKDIKLREPADENIYEYNLVNPQAFIGWVPPNAQDVQETLKDTLGQRSIPCLVVSYDEDNDDGQENVTQIRLTLVVYSPGVQTDEGEFTEDFTGYENLINFMDRTKAFLLRSKLSLGVTAIISSVKSSLYKEQPFPYWVGNITFTCQNQPYVRLDLAYSEQRLLFGEEVGK